MVIADSLQIWRCLPRVDRECFDLWPQKFYGLIYSGRKQTAAKTMMMYVRGVQSRLGGRDDSILTNGVEKSLQKSWFSSSSSHHISQSHQHKRRRQSKS